MARKAHRLKIDKPLPSRKHVLPVACTKWPLFAPAHHRDMEFGSAPIWDSGLKKIPRSVLDCDKFPRSQKNKSNFPQNVKNKAVQHQIA
jgi:hypothetical protein